MDATYYYWVRSAQPPEATFAYGSLAITYILRNGPHPAWLGQVLQADFTDEVVQVVHLPWGSV